MQLKVNLFSKAHTMNISVEVSYYPLHDLYLEPIQEFIDRMNTYSSLVVRTNGMSTQVFGEYGEVFDAIKAEIQAAFQLPHSVFILKVINADLQEIPGQ